MNSNAVYMRASKKMLSGTCLAAFFLLLVVINSNYARAQGEHSRRAAAELLVIADEVRRLREESPGTLVQTGL